MVSDRGRARHEHHPYALLAHGHQSNRGERGTAISRPIVLSAHAALPGQDQPLYDVERQLTGNEASVGFEYAKPKLEALDDQPDFLSLTQHFVGRHVSVPRCRKHGHRTCTVVKIE
jgi:hypothetical protein